jgi:polyribonucleotide nucleotidyltransferase
MVKVISIDKTGKIRLSRKEALADRAGQQAGAGAQMPPAAVPEQPKAKA